MEIHDILIDLEKRTLDIDKIISLEKSQRNFVASLFNELLLEISKLYDHTRTQQANECKISIIYRSLAESGYLVTRREKNLNQFV